jgi:hypothetical protein
MTCQYFIVHARNGTILVLVIYFHICALVNEVFNFLRVDMMPPTVEEDSNSYSNNYI